MPESDFSDPMDGRDGVGEPDALKAALVRMGLADASDDAVFTPLSGGVSSDIWRVDLPQRRICIKRALPRLRVAAEWWAPVERSGYEVAWMRAAASAVPEAAPQVLGEDRELGLFAMPYYEAGRYPLWKKRLLAGEADKEAAGAVASCLGRIHAHTAGDPRVAERFDTVHIFHPIRLEPYLLATARAHPDVAPALEALSEATAATRKALVHGDVSPKNILLGPEGPIFLDAECAWYGDPAFDAAFCLNHLLLKCLARPDKYTAYLNCFDRFVAVYLSRVDWEPGEDVARRAAHLLPGLFLGRIDGKSPVEYVTEEGERARVRRVAKRFLREPAGDPRDIREAWAEELSR